MTLKSQLSEFFLKIIRNKVYESELDLLRFYVLCFSIFPVLFSVFIYDGNVFPIWGIVLYPLIFAILFVMSFTIKWVEKHYVNIVFGATTALTLFGIGAALVNGFTLKYTLGLLIGIIIISNQIVRPRQLLIYGCLVLVFLTIALIVGDTSHIDPRYVFFFVLIYFLFINFFMIKRMKAFADIEQKELILSRIFDTSNDGIVLLDFRTLKLKRVNNHFLNLTGTKKLDLEEIFNLNIFLKNRINNHEFDIIKDTLLEKNTYTLERECKAGTGRIFWSEISFTTIITEDEKLLLLQITDIDARKRREEKLLKEKILAENYIDLTSGVIVVIDKQQKIALLNNYGCELLGATEDELIGKDYFSLFIPVEERDMVREFHKEIFTTHFINEKYNGRIVTITGEIRIMAWRNAFVYDDKGEISGSISYGLDITDELKLQEKNKLVESRLHNLVTNLPNAVFYETGGGREFITDNFIDLLGYPPSAFTENRSLFNSIIHPEDLPVVDAQIAKWSKEGENGVLRIEFRAINSNGTYQWIEDLVSPVKSDGQRPYYAGILLDITQRKRIEEDLRQSEEKFRLITTVAPIGIFQLNETGHPQFFNIVMEEITGLIGENFNKRTLAKIIHPADYVRISKEIEKILNQKQDFKGEFRIIPFESKTLRWVNLSCIGIFDSNIHKGWVVTVEDITEVKEISLRIQESEQRFRLLSDATTEGLFMSFDESIIDSNEQFVKMLGFAQKDDILGMKMEEFISPEILDAIRLNRKNKDHKTHTINIKRSNGSEFTAEIQEALVPYYGRPVQITVVNDVTERKRYEAELNDSNERFRSLIDYLPLGLVLLSDDNQFAFANSGAERIFGIQLNSLFSQNIRKFVITEHYPKIEMMLAQIRTNKMPESVEVRIFNKRDKKVVEAELNGTIVTINNVEFVQLTLQDISLRKMYDREQLRAQIAEENNIELQHEINERMKAESQLLSKKEYKKSLIESSIDIIVSTDIEFRIIEFNQAACQSFGYLFEEAFGQEIAILFDKKASYTGILNKLEQEGQFQGNISLKKKNGKFIDTYITVSQISIEGKSAGIICVIRDIGEKKKQEDELRESEERFRVIYNQAFIGIARISKAGRFILVNERVSGILGYSKEELYKKAFFQLIHPDDSEGVLNRWDELSTSTESSNFSMEHRFINNLNQEVFVNASVSLVRDSKGKPHYFIAAYEDISERKSAEIQIKESLKEKEILIKEIHHRVKNNMQVISSILNLQSLYIDDVKTIEMLKESQNRIKSMSFIHESLYQSNNLKHINFSEYIRNLASNLNQSSNLFRENIQLEFDLDETFLTLDTAIPLGLIINELITNSFKYAFEESKTGSVKISLKHLNPQTYSLSVSDTGKGLPNDIDIRNTETLGLQLVDTLVQQINASLSYSYQKGAIFVINFKEN